MDVRQSPDDILILFEIIKMVTVLPDHLTRQFFVGLNLPGMEWKADPQSSLSVIASFPNPLANIIPNSYNSVANVVIRVNRYSVPKMEEQCLFKK